MNIEDDFAYDDNDSVQYIKDFLPEHIKQKFDDDDLIYIIDLIYEFYESKGLMDDEMDESEDIEFDEDELVAYVTTNALSDGIGKYNAEDIALVIEAELSYCESIGMFEWMDIGKFESIINKMYYK